MTRFKQWREAAGLSLREVADLTGMSERNAYRIDSGEQTPPLATKVLIARRLGVRIADLFEVAEIEESVSA